MPLHMNVFRILGDVSHTASKCILIWSIHSNKSAEGVSLITQALYVLVFITRYLDLFWTSPRVSIWNFVLKNFYILSSVYIILLMTRIYARTREREKAWRLGLYCLGGSLVTSPLITLIFHKEHHFLRRGEVPWVFSIILESVCVLPQLLLLRQTTVPTVIDSFYLLTLGSYRAFYICNWIVRLASKEHYWDSIAVIFGIIQTAFYVDFAWVYWSRQRVKLRAGGVVDSDDLSRGWLISRILGHKHNELEDEETTHALDEDDEDDESGRRAASRRTTSSSGRWGARGISVSADHGLPDTPSRGHVHPGDVKARLALDSPADELGDILEGDEDEGLGPNISPAFAQETGVTSGEEWRDGSGK